MPVTAIIGLVLGLVVASAPMFMAIRLILLNGVLLVAASALGVGVADNALAAGLVMAVLAFIGAVWTAVPVVGAVFSGLPVLVFLLLVAKAQEFTSGAATLKVAIAAAIGLVAPIALAVLLSIADPARSTASWWRRRGRLACRPRSGRCRCRCCSWTAPRRP